MHHQAISFICEHHRLYLHKPRQYSLPHTQAICYSLLLLGCKPVHHITVLNTVGNCNTMISIIILYYNRMGPPLYMQSIIDQNVIMWRMTVYCSYVNTICLIHHTVQYVHCDANYWYNLLTLLMTYVACGCCPIQRQQRTLQNDHTRTSLQKRFLTYSISCIMPLLVNQFSSFPHFNSLWF